MPDTTARRSIGMPHSSMRAREAVDRRADAAARAPDVRHAVAAESTGSTGFRPCLAHRSASVIACAIDRRVVHRAAGVRHADHAGCRRRSARPRAPSGPGSARARRTPSRGGARSRMRCSGNGHTVAQAQRARPCRPWARSARDGRQRDARGDPVGDHHDVGAVHAVRRRRRSARGRSFLILSVSRPSSCACAAHRHVGVALLVVRQAGHVEAVALAGPRHRRHQVLRRRRTGRYSPGAAFVHWRG